MNNLIKAYFLVVSNVRKPNQTKSTLTLVKPIPKNPIALV